MPRGVAKSPETDKRRLHLGGKPKTGKIHKSYWAYQWQHGELERRLQELRAGESKDKDETK